MNASGPQDGVSLQRGKRGHCLEEDDTRIARELLGSWETIIRTPDVFEDLRGEPSEQAIVEQIQVFAITAFDSRANLALLGFAENPYWTRAWIC